MLGYSLTISPRHYAKVLANVDDESRKMWSRSSAMCYGAQRVPASAWG